MGRNVCEGVGVEGVGWRPEWVGGWVGAGGGVGWGVSQIGEEGVGVRPEWEEKEGGGVGRSKFYSTFSLVTSIQR